MRPVILVRAGRGGGVNAGGAAPVPRRLLGADQSASASGRGGLGIGRAAAALARQRRYVRCCRAFAHYLPTATPNGPMVPVMKSWLTSVPFRLAWPIVSAVGLAQ